MNFKYDILFTVKFRHTYFKDGSFNGLSIVPLAETNAAMRNYGLIFKAFPDRFTVMYDTAFAGNARSREMVLKEDIALNFKLDLTDLSLYNYTGGLPSAINDAVFYFSNINEDGSFRKNILHQEDFVSEKDFTSAAEIKSRYFSLPFGHVDLRVHPALEKNMELRFAARSVYWQYILLSEHTKNLNAPAVFNKNTRRVFNGPEIVQLSENLTGIAFMSEEPMQLNKEPNRFLQLLENYEEGNDKYRIIIDILPNPDINIISQNFSKENSDGEKNVITIIL